MKVTVFTSNGLRHKYLINSLSKNFDVNAIIETTSSVSTNSNVSPILNEYFSYVKSAERNVFGDNTTILANNLKEIEKGSLSKIDFDQINEFMNSDIFIVFGSSYIKEPLIDFLIDKKCINLHMGLSPFYRGAACNFWAQYDKRYDMIGGTIHYLSKGLDSGDIIKSVNLENGSYDRFEVGMIAVKKTIDQLNDLILQNKIFNIIPYKQDREREIRYSKIKDFNEDKAKEFLKLYKEDKYIKIE
ncbi:formyltransferase family protein [Niallia sp. Krafla_26]|uniref:formyltransferase family protein n=1 Tax=Niallia sp. Krafla_26 TaxID=3064703 RepID=UPI003D162703